MSSSCHPQIRLGLCCINNTLRAQNIYNNRTCIRRTYTPEKAAELALANLHDIRPILEWNHKHHIRHFRLSSDMFPHLLDPEVEQFEISQDMISALESAGEFAHQHLHRITMHPGQFNVIGTPKQDVFAATKMDLQMHAWILDTMNTDCGESVLCIHGGGVYGDKETTIRRWIEQFDELDSSVKQRLAIENCEKSYSIDDCIYIAEQCKIPVILDTHHYDCYKMFHPEEKVSELEDVLPQIVEGWSARNARPLFHISDPRDPLSNSRQMYCAHHDYVRAIPDVLLSLSNDCPIDIEVEAKAKESAIFHLFDKYKFLRT